MTEPTKWPRKNIAVSALHLDALNPRTQRASTGVSPRDLIQWLFDHEDALSVAESIATRGYFPTEPLLAVIEDDSAVVVEGNRRLAALKGLREPTLLKDTHRRALERLVGKLPSTDFLKSIPVIIAPNRRATDRLLVGRHAERAVRPWQAENRASFILSKLAEGYSTEELEDQLGFTASDITSARQTRAIVEMARSLDLEDAVRAKLDAPKTKVFSNLERVFDSTAGRDFLRLERDADHGVRIRTGRERFRSALKRLVEDLVLERQDSRSLNTNDMIAEYFAGWGAGQALPRANTSIVPHDVIGGPSIASAPAPPTPPPAPRNSPIRKTAIPRSFRIARGSEKLKTIRLELTRLDRTKHATSAAVMLRVFLEMAILDYLQHENRLGPLIARLKAEKQLTFDVPRLSQLVDEIRPTIRAQMSGPERASALKVLSHGKTERFTIGELNQFVHSPLDLPTAQEILVFWERIEPLMRFLLGRR